jgi:hypothetical protein
MTKGILLFLVFAAGIALMAAVTSTYYAHVGVGQALSNHGEAWAFFGEYFGGVAGPLLSFISILLLVYTVNLQIQQQSRIQEETLKRDVLAHISKADKEIDQWLRRKLATNTISDQTVEFGDVVWGILPDTLVSTREFKPAVIRLNRLTFLYCEALALYRANINEHFIFRYHKQKAQSLVDFLKAHEALLPVNERPALHFAQMHLDGECKTEQVA